MFLRLGLTVIVTGAIIPNELEIYCLVCSVAVAVSATNVLSGKGHSVYLVVRKLVENVSCRENFMRKEVKYRTNPDLSCTNFNLATRLLARH